MSPNLRSESQSSCAPYLQSQRRGFRIRLRFDLLHDLSRQTGSCALSIVHPFDWRKNVRPTRVFPHASGKWKSIRILLVDNQESWRYRVASMFRTRPELEIICEASDGLEAVRKAQELQPDLIVMNVGVSRLHELEIPGSKLPGESVCSRPNRKSSS